MGIGIKIKKGKIDLGISLEEYVSRLRHIDSLRILPVDENTWVENISLDWSNKDPADRTIVATARLENVPIITKDDIIREFHPNTIWEKLPTSRAKFLQIQITQINFNNCFHFFVDIFLKRII